MTACWRAHIESLWAIIWKRRRMAHCRIQELFNEVIAVIPVFSFHFFLKRNEWKRSFCYHLLVPQDKEKEIGTLWNQVITRRKLGLMTARYHFIAVISFLLLHLRNQLMKRNPAECPACCSFSFIGAGQLGFCLLNMSPDVRSWRCACLMAIGTANDRLQRSALHAASPEKDLMDEGIKRRGPKREEMKGKVCERMNWLFPWIRTSSLITIWA